MNELGICTCTHGHDIDHKERVEHYRHNFIPTGWELIYTSLDHRDTSIALHLTGWCLRCGSKNLRISEDIPGDSGDALLERIYRQVGRFRPYDYRFENGTYRTALSVRAQWYMEQDDLTLGAKNAQFLKLFHLEDQAVVEEWLNRCHAEEPYTAPQRDRKSSLLYAVLDRARASGDLKEIEPILDYYLPNRQEPPTPDEDSYLTDYSFSTQAKVSYGCEGIFVDLDLVGSFDDSGDNRCCVGTFKTLREDAEAGRLMGQLCGILMYHATKYVNENIHRYTPRSELESDLRRQKAKGRGSSGYRQ